MASGQKILISEVELELSGSRDVTALQAIATNLSQRVALIPSCVSKAQRAYDLMAAVTGV